MQCPVVKVKFDNEQGYYLLNESDFDESKHELFIEPSKTKPSKTKPSKIFTEPSETENPQTEDIGKSDAAVSVARTQDVGAAGPKPPWASGKTES
jgi:hypothetical protein